jgi:FkbM family methyltransferase
MRLPLILRYLPSSIADRAYWRIYSHRQQQPLYRELFEFAPLSVAPGIGMFLSNMDHMHGMIAFTGTYERELTRLIRDRAERGGTLVDVGANWGYFTLIWASAKANNRVISIEASPRNISPLRENIRRNNLHDRVNIVDAAAGRGRESMQFDLGPLNETGWGKFVRDKTENTVEVKVIPLDEICDGLDRVEFVKIDVEGAESLVLEGSRKLLRASVIREVFLELNENLGISTTETYKILREYGYRCNLRQGGLHAKAPES